MEPVRALRTGQEDPTVSNGSHRILAALASALLLSTAAGAATDLIYSRRGGSPLWDFCYGKADSTALPPDPRTLVQPGVSDGRAVHFNAFWKDCHVDPVAVQEAGHAKTCGELRQRFYRGDALLDTGGPGVAALFTGDDPTTPESLFGSSTLTAAQYNLLWTTWGGFLVRPDNFDELVAERYGSAFGGGRNPYPKPGENPNTTNGGSGRLPEMFTQLRNPDGKWSGRIGITCHGCHSGAADGTYAPGGGSSLADLHLLLRDAVPLGYLPSLAAIANLTRTRGTNNASDINLAFLFPDEGVLPLDVALGVLASGSTASMDTPAWWNMGHRPVKFVDGVFPMDAPRVDMVFYTPFFGLFGSLGGPISEAGQDWMRQHGPDLNTWVDTLKAPVYPAAVNTALAEEGAVLFHTLNLWAAGRSNPVPRPQGNGSCASCHGAYAPRYVNDPSFLATPALEGQAAYIAPQRIIATDPVRMETNDEAVQIAGANNFFGYPPTAGTANDCGPQNRSDLRGNRELGYLAQPLYGVWASAPYLHNGSVPNVWEVLKPSDRKPLWRRKSKAPRWDQTGRVIMGYDTRMSAYDTAKLGWKYDTIACQNPTLLNPFPSPYLRCNPDDDLLASWYDEILTGLYSNFILAWNVLFPPTITNTQIEQRKIYNAYMYGQGNGGHAFTSVLTDAERRSIIEYLKTL
jgi:mono/diheme cytochrome c family protein